LRRIFPEVEERAELRRLYQTVSSAAPFRLQHRVQADPSLIGTSERITFKARANVDQLLKGHIDRSLPEDSRVLTDSQIGWIDTLVERGQLRLAFNTGFFTNGDSRDPEQAGVLGALVGSMLTLAV